MIADGIARAFNYALIMLFVIGVTMGAGLVWGVPKLWHWLKPILHAWTG